MIEQFHILSYCHKNIKLNRLGQFVLEPESENSILAIIKQKFDLKEIMYLGTCNRVEYIFVTNQKISQSLISEFLSSVYPAFNEKELNSTYPVHYNGMDAVTHFFRTISSLESMVTGEKEITAQMKRAYENANLNGFTGGLLKAVMDQGLKTSRKIFTQTRIAENPVSVVSLASRHLERFKINKEANFLIIGAGQTNKLMAKYLLKNGYKNFDVFNRTLSNAKDLAGYLKGNYYSLEKLKSYSKHFDVLISCTSSPLPVITEKIYQKLNPENKNKIIIDLAVPNDIAEEVKKTPTVTYISIGELENTASENKTKRSNEMIAAATLVKISVNEFFKQMKEREIELAMQEVPKKIKEIRSKATQNVFHQQISKMDEESKALLNDILNYVEKKYISVPMKMAREILAGS